ncbi:glycosyltransferase [Neobacillus sp. 179-J 1A1 HS]|uniref:glycosyltransferase family 4 protein n=1 Tax=Neobacillus driksii TaxID=3035913 RepID=UPI0035BBD683
MKKKILVLNGQYLPGFKGGGPIQSCYNMIEELSEHFEFLVLTADRDYKSELPYPNVKINQWNQVGSAKVFYMSPELQSLKGFKQILNGTEYDILYLNGFFSQVYTIRPLLLRWLGQLKKKKIILSPRGDFTGGLENKRFKKYSYIILCRTLGLYNHILWHATSKLEDKDIKSLFKNAETFMVPNLAAKFIPKEPINRKKTGELKMVFVSRIFPKKNLKYALEILKEINGRNITFDIYGPMEDKVYWSECEAIIRLMPQNVKVNYKGEVQHSNIPLIFEQYHAFFFPTLGENYGHVIVEAMMNNCIAILSAGVTPWDDYHQNGGFVIPLDQNQAFIDCIKYLCDMTHGEYQSLQKKNALFIANKLAPGDNLGKYIELFD